MACLARAIFDNVAESPQELAFRKGDLLQVLERNPNGLNGWWLCRLRSQEGLAAANRLQLSNMDAATADYDIPRPLLSEKTRHLNGVSSPHNNTYDIPRPSWQPDSPPSVRSYRSSEYFLGSSAASSSGSSNSGSSRFSIATSDLGPSERNSVEPFGEIYDVLSGQVPRKVIGSPEPFSPTARSSVSSKDGDYDFIDADVSVSPVPNDHYDRLPAHRRMHAQMPKTRSKDPKKRESLLRSVVLPKKSSPPPKIMPTEPDTLSNGSQHNLNNTDEMSRKLPIYEPLNITKQAAVMRISHMQSQVQTELSRLFSFVSYQKWRETTHLETRLTEVKLCCEYLVLHLKNLIRFLLQAALVSARKASDASLELKLQDLIDPVYLGCKKIRDHLEMMQKENWKASEVTVNGIEEIVATGQILTEDVRKMTAFVLGNAQLIFSEVEEQKLQKRPLPIVPDRFFVEVPEMISELATGDDNEYEDVDYGTLSAPLQPRSPTLERRILNSYIQEVNEEVKLIRPLISSFTDRMFADQTVTSVATIESAETVVTRTAKLSRLTESLFSNLTSTETEELRTKLKKIGGYISTASRRFNSELRAATKTPDDAHFRNVKTAVDYLNELCQLLRNSTETEV